jgi:molybdopterin synthase sulfur carrier subunit
MRWKLFANLAETAGEKEVAVDVPEGATLREAFDALLDAHPGLREEVLDAEGELHEHVNVLHNDANPFVEGDGFDTELAAGDRLALFPPVSGG